MSRKIRISKHLLGAAMWQIKTTNGNVVRGHSSFGWNLAITPAD